MFYQDKDSESCRAPFNLLPHSTHVSRVRYGESRKRILNDTKNESLVMHVGVVERRVMDGLVSNGSKRTHVFQHHENKPFNISNL